MSRSTARATRWWSAPVLGWRAEQFAAQAGADGTGRSPIERALVALISPVLFPSERAFLARNTYRLRYRDFDWRLNDLTGAAPAPHAILGPAGRRAKTGSLPFDFRLLTSDV